MPDYTSSEQKHNVKHSSRPVIFATPKPIPADDALLSRSPSEIIPAAPCSNTFPEARPAGRAITRLFPNPFHRDSTSFCSPPSLPLSSPLKCCLCSPVLKGGSLCNNNKPMQPSMQALARSLHLPCDRHNSLPVGPAHSTCPAAAGTADHKALVADTDLERTGLSHSIHGWRLLAVGTGSKAGVKG